MVLVHGSWKRAGRANRWHGTKPFPHIHTYIHTSAVKRQDNVNSTVYTRGAFHACAQPINVPLDNLGQSFIAVSSLSPSFMNLLNYLCSTELSTV